MSLLATFIVLPLLALALAVTFSHQGYATLASTVVRQQANECGVVVMKAERKLHLTKKF